MTWIISYSIALLIILLGVIFYFGKARKKNGFIFYASAETIYKSHMQSLIYVCEAMLDKLDGDELMSDFECAQIIHGLLETGS